MEVRDEGFDTGIVERRKLNWSAIFAGVVATLGLQVMLMYFGSALGLSTFNPYDASEMRPGLPWGTMIFLLITAVGSSFFGAWVAGHWANLWESEDAYMTGALTWGLSVILATVGGLAAVGVASGVTSAGAEAAMVPNSQNSRTTNSGDRGDKPLVYSPLDDQRFASFVLDRAKTWQDMSPKSNDEAINVSADKRDSKSEKAIKVEPDDVAKDERLIDYVTANTRMSEDQAKEFLSAEKESIARAETESQRRWQQANARELSMIERSRKVGSALAWTATIVAFLSLCAAVGGSYLGWRQRYNNHGLNRGPDPVERDVDPDLDDNRRVI